MYLDDQISHTDDSVSGHLETMYVTFENYSTALCIAARAGLECQYGAH